MSTMLFEAIPPATSCISAVARNNPIFESSGWSPFSKRIDASVRMLKCDDVRLTLIGSKLADSMRMSVVVSLISVCLPPITPARAIAFSPSHITRVDGLSFSDCSSRVSNVSFDDACLIMIRSFSKVFKSNAWGVVPILA